MNNIRQSAIKIGRVACQLYENTYINEAAGLAKVAAYLGNAGLQAENQGIKTASISDIESLIDNAVSQVFVPEVQLKIASYCKKIANTKTAEGFRSSDDEEAKKAKRRKRLALWLGIGGGAAALGAGGLGYLAYQKLKGQKPNDSADILPNAENKLKAQGFGIGNIPEPPALLDGETAEQQRIIHERQIERDSRNQMGVMSSLAILKEMDERAKALANADKRTRSDVGLEAMVNNNANALPAPNSRESLIEIYGPKIQDMLNKRGM